MSEDDSQYNQMLGDEISANLMLDPSTRMWRLELQGPAAMLLFFLLDPSEESLAKKLWEEARFDQLMRFDLGDVDTDWEEEFNDDAQPNW